MTFNWTNIDNKSFAKLLKTSGIIKEDSLENDQILCHAPGAYGIEHLNDILNDGLLIKRNFKDSNNYVSSGVLSTNVLMNSSEDNSVDIDKILHYDYGRTDTNGNRYVVVSSIPQKLQNILLGKIIEENEYRKRGLQCVLDELEIEKLFPQFILGVVKISPKGSTQFKLNNKFFAINKKNENLAVKNVLELFEKKGFKTVDDYYKFVDNIISISEVRVSKGLPPISIPKYKKNISEIYKQSLFDKSATC